MCSPVPQVSCSWDHLLENYVPIAANCSSCREQVQQEPTWGELYCPNEKKFWRIGSPGIRTEPIGAGELSLTKKPQSPPRGIQSAGRTSLKAA